MHIRIVRLLACLLVAVSLVGLLTLRPAAHAAAPAVQVWLTTTDGANHLTRQTDLQLNSGSGASPAITINDAQQYPQMDGFGAPLTDSSAWLLYTKMSASQRNTVMTNLFGTDPSNPTSIGLSFVRIPMGASDFSINGAYSYDDMPAGQTDPTLAHFSIAHDTSYPGTPVLFSWASGARTTDYVYDKESASAARDQLEVTLRLLAQSGARRIDIVAHSMGTWVTMETLRQLRARDVVLPAVLITSHPKASLRTEAAAAGAPILEKPLLGETLAGAIRAALGHQPHA